MKKRKRTYNVRLIKDDYSYYIEQIADLLGNDVATVRRWVREEGLERIPNTRPHIVHSSKLKAFINKQKERRKKPCAIHEIFCLRCQSPRIPLAGSATVIPLPNGCISIKAICSECGGKMNRSIRGAEWIKSHPLAIYLSDASGEHKSVQLTHHECSLHKEENNV